MFHVEAFDGVITFKYLESENLINSRMERAFGGK